MDLHYDIENKIFEISTKIKQDLHREFIESKEEDYDYNCNPWSVAVGKNFSVVTDGKRGWFAHVYLKNTVSMLVWRTVWVPPLFQMIIINVFIQIFLSFSFISDIDFKASKIEEIDQAWALQEYLLYLPFVFVNSGKLIQISLRI